MKRLFLILLLLGLSAYGFAADISKAHTWVDGETPTAALWNGNEDPLYSTINDLGGANLATDIAITTSGNCAFNGTLTAGSTLGVATSANPDAADGATLGTTSLEWSDIYFADGAVINLGADQDVTITHVADTGIQMELSDKILFGDTAVWIASLTDGHLDLDADVSIDIEGPWTAASQTCADLGTVTTANIDGGSIDGTTVGATSASTGAFTTLTASGATTLNGATTIGDAAADTLLINANTIEVEGATANGYENVLSFPDPTSSDNTYTFPSGGGTFVVSGAAQTNTSQPCFSVSTPGTQTNIAADNSVITVILSSEVIDQTSSFASNTFTAPNTGRYQLNLFFVLASFDTAATYYTLQIITSNRTYTLSPEGNTYANDCTFHGVITVVADMDVNDTAYCTIQQNGGVAQSDISAATYFSGALLN